MNASSGPVLRDIHLPPPLGWWPPAPGWWLVAALLLMVCIVLLWKLIPRWRRRRRARRVLGEFERQIGTLRDADDPAALATVLSGFARRLLRKSAPQVVALSGADWLAQLDRTGKTDEFTCGIGRALAEAPYQPCANYDTAALIALMRRWTRRVVQLEVGRV